MIRASTPGHADTKGDGVQVMQAAGVLPRILPPPPLRGGKRGRGEKEGEEAVCNWGCGKEIEADNKM